MRLVLNVPCEVAADWRRLFESALPNAAVEVREPGGPVNRAASPADYAVMYGPCTTIFAEQRALKAVFALSAGIAYLLALPDVPRSTPLIRLEDAGMAEQMVRYVQAAALRVVLRLDVYARQQGEARWEQHVARTPSSVKAGVMGLGVIGGQVARALSDMGFAVRGLAQAPRKVRGVEVFAGVAELDAFLDGLDFVVSVLPATPATKGILNRGSMARLADGAHVVNIGRGAALVEEDLVALLAEGKLSGATLDVFREEPLPPDHPFWQCPGIVVTPHVSGLTVPEAAVAQVAGKIAQLERGEPVSGIVAIEKGY